MPTETVRVDWLTDRELWVELIGSTVVVAEELLTAGEIEELQRRLTASPDVTGG